MESTTFGSFDYITNPGGSLSHLTYLGRVHPRLEVLHQKYCQVSAGRPKNIGKGYKFFTKWHQIWQEFLKIVFTGDFSSVLIQNYQILKLFCLDPKVSNSAKNFDPKMSDRRPCIYSVQVAHPTGLQEIILLPANPAI